MVPQQKRDCDILPFHIRDWPASESFIKLIYVLWSKSKDTQKSYLVILINIYYNFS